MRLGRVVAMGALGVVVIGVIWGAITSSNDRAPIRPVLQRMVSLENPLVLSPQVLTLGKTPSPTMKRQWWSAESKTLARTFIPGSRLIARDRHIYRVTLARIQDERSRTTYERVRVYLEAVMAVGPWARATWGATVAFAGGGTHHARPSVNGEAGVAYLHRVHGHWRVVTYSEHYIPGEGP